MLQGRTRCNNQNQLGTTDHGPHSLLAGEWYPPAAVMRCPAGMLPAAADTTLLPPPLLTFAFLGCHCRRCLPQQPQRSTQHNAEASAEPGQA